MTSYTSGLGGSHWLHDFIKKVGGASYIVNYLLYLVTFKKTRWAVIHVGVPIDIEESWILVGFIFIKVQE